MPAGGGGGAAATDLPHERRSVCGPGSARAVSFGGGHHAAAVLRLAAPSRSRIGRGRFRPENRGPAVGGRLLARVPERELLPPRRCGPWRPSVVPRRLPRALLGADLTAGRRSARRS